MQLGSAVTVVDATKCKMYMKNFGEFFNNQIEHAGTVILSRTQDMKEEKLQEVIALVKEQNHQRCHRHHPLGRPDRRPDLVRHGRRHLSGRGADGTAP